MLENKQKFLLFSLISIFLLCFSSCKMKAEQKSLTSQFETIDALINQSQMDLAVKSLKKIEKKEKGFIVMSGLATGVSWMCYYRALKEGPASVIVPIDKLSILITIAFSWIVFHEKLTKKAAIGLGGIVAGTFLLAIL